MAKNLYQGPTITGLLFWIGVWVALGWAFPVMQIICVFFIIAGILDWAFSGN